MLLGESSHDLPTASVHVDIADLSPPDHTPDQCLADLQSRCHLLDSEQRFIRELCRSRQLGHLSLSTKTRIARAVI